MSRHTRTALLAVALVGVLAVTSAACSSGPPDPSEPLASAPAAASAANSADVTVPALTTAGVLLADIDRDRRHLVRDGVRQELENVHRAAGDKHGHRRQRRGTAGHQG